ncbi:hypothetical protein ACI2OX_11130 [Bacillus sp. N9]
MIIVDEMNREWTRKEYEKLKIKTELAPRNPELYFDGALIYRLVYLESVSSYIMKKAMKRTVFVSMQSLTNLSQTMKQNMRHCIMGCFY